MVWECDFFGFCFSSTIITSTLLFVMSPLQPGEAAAGNLDAPVPETGPPSDVGSSSESDVSTISIISPKKIQTGFGVLEIRTNMSFYAGGEW